jgi:maltose alpha-D-glucosyltransferase/alpha-amylase
MQFWLDRGVDGLRLDAVPYLIEREGTICENLEETHEVLKKIRRALDSSLSRPHAARRGQPVAGRRAPVLRRGRRVPHGVPFPADAAHVHGGAAGGSPPIVEILRQTPDIPENCQWAMFLRNHDELTLEMVTDEERDYMYQAYAADPQMRINVGIRRRLAPLLENSRRRIELLHSLLFSMPGTPVVYYGDELGMGDNIYLGDRNGRAHADAVDRRSQRRLLAADPAALYAPPIMDPVYGYQAINVEAQERAPFSLLNWMKRVIGLRKQSQVFGPRHDRVPARQQPEDPGLPAQVQGRRDPLRREPLALGQRWSSI